MITLLNQGSDLYDRFRRKPEINLFLSRKLFICLLIAWLLASTILSWSFQCLLLNSYRFKTPLLTINNLDDIVAHPKLLVAGVKGVKQLKLSRYDVYSALIEQAEKYENSLGVNTSVLESSLHENPTLINDVINQRAVIIANDFTTKSLRAVNPEYNLQESDEKLNLVYKFSYINKDHPMEKVIFFR